MSRIKAFDLIDAGAGVLGQVEYVDRAVAENDPHANRSVTKAVDASITVGNGIVL